MRAGTVSLRKAVVRSGLFFGYRWGRVVMQQWLGFGQIRSRIEPGSLRAEVQGREVTSICPFPQVGEYLRVVSIDRPERAVNQVRMSFAQRYGPSEEVQYGIGVA